MIWFIYTMYKYITLKYFITVPQEFINNMIWEVIIELLFIIHHIWKR